VDHLGPGYRTIAYDRRGFGDTTFEAEPHADTDDAVAVLAAEAVASAVVIAASNGGKIALDLALAHPERVEALVLIASAVRGAPEEDPADFSDRVRRLYSTYEAAEEAADPDELNRVEAHAWLDGWAAEEGRVQGSARELFLEMNGRALRSADTGPARELPPLWDRLGEVSVPTLVLCGDLDVLCLPTSEHLATQLPHATYEVLEATGHLPHLEGHPRCLDAITDFLGSLPQRDGPNGSA
jgi:pimeloyl-ACP methyl ester carboxylesterase